MQDQDLKVPPSEALSLDPLAVRPEGEQQMDQQQQQQVDQQ